MPDKIDSDDIIDLSKAVSQVEKLIELFERLAEIYTKELKNGIKLVQGDAPDSAKKLKDFNINLEKLRQKTEALNSVNGQKAAQMQEEFRLKKLLQKANAKLIKSNSEEAKEIKLVAERQRELNKTMKQNARERLNLVGAYEKESIKLNKLRKDYKNLAAAGRENGKVARGLKNEIDQLDKKLKKIDTSVGQSQRFVGEYEKGWRKVRMELNRFAAAAGVTVGLNEIRRGVESSVDAFKDWESTINNVLTLLSDDEIAEFGEQIKEGSVGIVKKYGFAIEDVNKALFDAVSAGVPAGDAIEFLDKSAILAIGSVTSLGVAVDGTTSILNAYNLGVESTTQVQDAFFSAQKAGKTTVEELSNAIGQLAPIAANANIPFQDILAGMATLTTGGLSTDEATTSLKGLLNSLQNAGPAAVEVIEDLNKELGINIPKSVSELRKVGLGNALKDITIAGEANADAITKIIPNIRGLTAAFALSGEGLEKYDDILKQVNEDTGEGSSLMKAFERQNETASQAAKRQAGEINALRIEIGEKLLPILNDVRGSMISFGKFLFKNRVEIKKLMTVIIAAVTTYKAWVLIQKISNKELVKGGKLEKALAVSTRLLSAAKALLTGNVRKANVQMKLLNRSMKFSPTGLLLTGLAALTTAMVSFGGSAESAAEQQERLNAAQEHGAEVAEKNATKIDRLLSNAEKRMNRAIELAQSQGKSEEEINEIRSKGLEVQITRAEVLARNQDRVIAKDKKQVEILRAARKEFLDARNKEKQKLGEAIGIPSEANVSGDLSDIVAKRERAQKALKDITSEIVKQRKELTPFASTTETIAFLNGKIKEEEKKKTELLEKANDLTHEIEVSVNDQLKITKDLTKEQKKAFDQRVKELAILKMKLEDLRDASIEDDLERELQQTTRKFQREINAIKGNSEIEVQLRVELEKTLTRELIRVWKKYQEDVEQINLQDVDEGRRKAAKDSAQEQADFERELREALAKAFIDDLESQQKKEDEALQKKIDNLKKAQAILDKFDEARDLRAEQRISKIDEEIEATRARESTLRELAEKGDLDAQKSITAEIRRQEKLEKEKEKIQRRQQQREFALAAFKAYTSKLESGDATPALSTIKDLFKIHSAVSTMPTFIEGTEGAKTISQTLGAPDIPGEDGYIIRADGRERIFNPQHADMIGGVTNDQVARIVQSHKKNMSFSPFEGSYFTNMTLPFSSDNETKRQLSEVNSKLSNSGELLKKIVDKPSYMGGDFNAMAMAFEAYIKHGNSIHKKVNKISDIGW